MLKILRIIPWIFLSIFVVLAAATANPCSTSNEPEKETQLSQKKRVLEWFKKYDEIRRDAEMSLTDKFQAMLMATGNPSKRNVALATKMAAKYKTAHAEIKNLEPIPESRELQDGYTEYFSEAYQLLDKHLKDQDVNPLNNKSFLRVKQHLEKLDNKNKKIDEDLRKEFHIPKHRRREI